jgi:fatty acid desaturase
VSAAVSDLVDDARPAPPRRPSRPPNEPRRFPRRSRPGRAPSSEAQRIRRAYGARVRAITRPPPGLLALARDAGLHLAFAATVAFAHHALLARDVVAGALAWPLAAYLVATRLRALANMLHEASHGLLVRDRRANRVVGSLLAVVDFTSLDAYTAEHFTHHRHLGDPVKDLDFAARLRLGFAARGPRFTVLHGLRPLTLFHLGAFLRPTLRDPAGAPWVAAARALYLLALAAALVTRFEVTMLYAVLPYLTAYQVVRYWSDAADHAGILGESEELNRARNHILPGAILNWIVMPRQDQYHLVHHLFPAVPVRDQGAVHRLLLGDPAYAARDHSFAAALRGGL